MPYLPDNREYRMMSPLEPVQDSEFIVEGYAATFEAYRMATIDGVDYYERIMPSAFEGSDMSDVIMLYDHTGRVFARQSNGTLELAVDSRGLKIRADLSLTPAARELYNDIKVGLVTQMSLAFAVDKDHFDTEKLKSVRKIIRNTQQELNIYKWSADHNYNGKGVGYDYKSGDRG